MIEYTVIVRKNSTRWYNLEGQLHRVDGPAVEYADGNKLYYINGELHREDGPSIEHVDGSKSYYIKGRFLSETEFNNRSKPCTDKVVEVDGVKYKLVKI